MPENSAALVKLVELRHHWFTTEDGQVVNLEHATPAQFDGFITKYVKITNVDRTLWPLVLRWQAVNFAVKNGKFLAFCNPPVEVAQEQK